MCCLSENECVEAGLYHFPKRFHMGKGFVSIFEEEVGGGGVGEMGWVRLVCRRKGCEWGQYW